MKVLKRFFQLKKKELIDTILPNAWTFIGDVAMLLGILALGVVVIFLCGWMVGHMMNLVLPSSKPLDEWTIANAGIVFLLVSVAGFAIVYLIGVGINKFFQWIIGNWERAKFQIEREEREK